MQNTTKNINPENRAAPKRSSEGEIKCACKTKCSTRLCSCRKNELACSNCNCNPENCQNKIVDSVRLAFFYNFKNCFKSTYLQLINYNNII